MKNDYSWVAEKKQEAMRRKLQQRGMPRYAQRPVSERFGVSYTGLGDDGRLDRSAPAGIDMYPSPHVFHEGETRIATPEGRAYLSADVTAGAGLGGQAPGAPMGQGAPMPGFAAGGGMMAGTAGYTGARDAPQYAPAPRVGSNPYMANIVPGNNQPAQQNNQNAQQYQPRVQGWNVNPAAMGNYGAAMLAQRQAQPTPAPAPQQQPVPVPQQPQPNAPAPRVGSNPYMADIMGGQRQFAQGEPQAIDGQLPGFASGGGITRLIQTARSKIPTIGEGGQSPTPTVGGGENSGNSGAGSVGGAGTSGTAGASGSGLSAMANSGWDTVNSTVKNTNKGVAGAVNAINSGVQKANNWINNNGGIIGATKTGLQWLNNPAGANAAAQNADNTTNALAAQEADKGEMFAQVAAQEEERKRQEEERKRMEDEAATAANPYLQNQIDTANSTPLSSEMFLRNPYTDKQLSDMRRQAAAEQAYLQHQQAMRGTDANAAWAQSQMTRAQQEEGINNFAAAAAAQDFDTMRGLAMSFLTSDDPSVRAKGAQMMNHFLPGSNIDWTSTITEANAGVVAKQFQDATAWALSGMSADDIYKNLKLQYGDAISDAMAGDFARAATLDDLSKAINSAKSNEWFNGLSPEDQQAYIDIMTIVYSGGAQKMVYNVKDKDGNITPYPTKEAADAAVAQNAGSQYIGTETTIDFGYLDKAINNTDDVTGGGFEFDPTVSDPFSSEFSSWLEADGNGEFKHPKEAGKLVEAMGTAITKDRNLSTQLPTLSPKVRDAVIDAAIGKGGKVVADGIKYVRQDAANSSDMLNQSASGFRELDDAYTNNKILFFGERPAMVTARHSTGSGLGGGDYRDVYTIMFLDTGSSVEIGEGTHWKSGDTVGAHGNLWRHLNGEYAPKEDAYAGKYAPKKG